MMNFLAVRQKLAVAFLLLAGALVGCRPQASLPTAAQSDVADATPEPIQTPQKFKVESLAKEIDDALQENRIDDAERLLKQQLLRQPDDVVTIFRLAEIQAHRGQFADAVELLGEIAADDPQAGLAAIGQDADWALLAGDYSLAEQNYLKVLQRVPDAQIARRQLAFLYNCQVRRFEAADLIRDLCRAGDVLEDELRSLIFVADGIYDSPTENENEEVVLAGEDRRYTPIGGSGRARLAMTENRWSDAADELRPELTSNSPPSLWAMYGRIVTLSQDDQQTARWLRQIRDDPTLAKRVTQHPEYWVAIGTLAVQNNEFDLALAAFLRALDGESSDVRVVARLRQVCTALGQSASTEFWQERFERLNALNRRRIELVRIGTAFPNNVDKFGTRANDS